jgi:hypothetical protein
MLRLRLRRSGKSAACRRGRRRSIWLGRDEFGPYSPDSSSVLNALMAKPKSFVWVLLPSWFGWHDLLCIPKWVHGSTPQGTNTTTHSAPFGYHRKFRGLFYERCLIRRRCWEMLVLCQRDDARQEWKVRSRESQPAKCVANSVFSSVLHHDTAS